MSEERGLGQRTGVEICNSAWTEAELNLVSEAGFTTEEVTRQWVVTQPDATLTIIIGSLSAYRKGEGQVRNEPFAKGSAAEPASTT